MIKLGIINFLKSLKYYLTALGGIALFLTIGLIILISNCITSISNMLDAVSNLFGGIAYNWDACNEVVIRDVSSLDWTHDFMTAVTTLFSGEFINATLAEGLIAAFGRDDIPHAVIDILNQCGREITYQVIIFIVILAIGIIVSFIFTRMLIHHEIATIKHHPFRFIIRTLIDALLFVGNIALIFWLNTYWDQIWIWFAVVGIALLYAVLTLVKAYFIYGGPRHIPLNKILNLNQIIILYLADIIILALGLALIILMFYLINAILAVVLGIPLLIVTIIAMDLNAESYVKQYCVF